VGRSARRAPFGRRAWLTAPAALATVTLVAVEAGSARAAVTLPTGPSPLPGSTFQGEDGNQEDAPPNLVDRQAFEQAGRVVHNPDGGLQFGPASSRMRGIPLTADDARDLLRGMRRGMLTPAERRALELHEQGLGYGRIARELGVSKGTVQAAIARARRKLRDPLLRTARENPSGGPLHGWSRNR
jgi:DNA-binding CsgD family transcriptional regulator